LAVFLLLLQLIDLALGMQIRICACRNNLHDCKPLIHYVYKRHIRIFKKLLHFNQNI